MKEHSETVLYGYEILGGRTRCVAASPNGSYHSSCTFPKSQFQPLPTIVNHCQPLHQSLPSIVNVNQPVVSCWYWHYLALLQVLFLLGFLSGLAGGSGSRFMNCSNARSTIPGLHILMRVLKKESRAEPSAGCCSDFPLANDF